MLGKCGALRSGGIIQWHRASAHVAAAESQRPPRAGDLENPPLDMLSIWYIVYNIYYMVCVVHSA